MVGQGIASATVYKDLDSTSAAGVSDTTAATTVQGLPPTASAVPQPPADESISTVAANQTALDIPGVVAGAQAIYGEAYAGYWLDNSGSLPEMHIAVAGSENPSLDQAFMIGLNATARAQTTIDQVKYNSQQLESYQQTLAQYAAANFGKSSDQPDGMMFSIDTIDNAVSVGVTSEDYSLVAALQSLVPSDALRIQQSFSALQNADGPGWVTGDSRHTYPPYKGGLHVVVGGNFCTSGFVLEVGGITKALSPVTVATLAQMSTYITV